MLSICQPKPNPPILAHIPRQPPDTPTGIHMGHRFNDVRVVVDARESGYGLHGQCGYVAAGRRVAVADGRELEICVLVIALG